MTNLELMAERYPRTQYFVEAVEKLECRNCPLSEDKCCPGNDTCLRMFWDWLMTEGDREELNPMQNPGMIADMLRLQSEYDQLVFEAYGAEGGYEFLWNQQGSCRMLSALFDELGELNHELKAGWVWWKKTQPPVNREAVLEELADVMHFCFMWPLAYDESMGDTDNRRDFIDGWEWGKQRARAWIAVGNEPENPSKLILDFLEPWDETGTIESCEQIGQNLFRLIDALGFTEEEAYEAYKRKNAINRQRVRDGY